MAVREKEKHNLVANFKLGLNGYEQPRCERKMSFSISVFSYQYLRGCLCKIRPLILLRKFDFLHKLEFRSPYLINH